MKFDTNIIAAELVKILAHFNLLPTAIAELPLFELLKPEWHE
jgi:hypothetical protein